MMRILLLLLSFAVFCALVYFIIINGNFLVSCFTLLGPFISLLLFSQKARKVILHFQRPLRIIVSAWMLLMFLFLYYLETPLNKTWYLLFGTIFSLIPVMNLKKFSLLKNKIIHISSLGFIFASLPGMILLTYILTGVWETVQEYGMEDFHTSTDYWLKVIMPILWGIIIPTVLGICIGIFTDQLNRSAKEI